jgi:hypothetical protein
MQKHFDLRLPRNFQEFLIKKRTYLIKSNKELRKSIPIVRKKKFNQTIFDVFLLFLE